MSERKKFGGWSVWFLSFAWLFLLSPGNAQSWWEAELSAGTEMGSLSLRRSISTHLALNVEVIGISYNSYVGGGLSVSQVYTNIAPFITIWWGSEIRESGGGGALIFHSGIRVKITNKFWIPFAFTTGTDVSRLSTGFIIRF